MSACCAVCAFLSVCVFVCPCSNYNENVDCYSAAMVLWYMCMADRPFGDLDADLIMAGAANGLRPELSCIERRHGKIMSAAIKNCWEADPAKRHSAEQLLEAMREQLQYIQSIKAHRSLPASIYRWASSAANRVSAAIASSKKGPSRAHEGKLPDAAADAAHRPSLDKTTGSHASLCNLDGTNTSVASTATWSLDNTNNSVTTNSTANTNNLDGTANTTVSVRSTSDDWFSQVAQERQTQSSVTASGEGEPTNSHGLGHALRD